MSVSLDQLFLYSENDINNFLNGHYDTNSLSLADKRYITTIELNKKGRILQTDVIYLENKNLQKCFQGTNSGEELKRKLYISLLEQLKTNNNLPPLLSQTSLSSRLSALPGLLTSSSTIEPPPTYQVSAPIKSPPRASIPPVNPQIIIDLEQEERNKLINDVENGYSGLRLTENEYNSLPEYLKTKYNWNRQEEEYINGDTHQREKVIVYIRGR